ncbi:MAG: hypothetical protein ACQEVA_02595 [Myxococcota bacterium]
MSEPSARLQKIADAISEVYPLGVAGDPYLCLLRVLDEQLDDVSDEQMARVLADCFDMEVDWALRDVRRVRDIEGLDDDQCDDIEELLADAGLDLH